MATNSDKATDGGKEADGYPKKTAGDLSDKDKSSITSGPLKVENELQAKQLISLVVAGQDPVKLMTHAIEQISENSGPYHIGSKVKINRAATVEKVGGGSLSLSRGDVVSVVQANLGEHGTDKMVLLSDGATRAIVPMIAMGESVDVGPDAYMMTDKSGKPLSAPSKAQGDAEPTDDAAAQKAGSSTSVTHPSTAQGAAEPDDDAAASKAGQGTPAVLPGKAVEAKKEILQNIAMAMESETNLNNYKVLTGMRRAVESFNNVKQIARLHEMLFGKKEYTIEQFKAKVEKYEADAKDKDKDEDDDDKKPFGGDKKNMKSEADDKDKDKDEDDDADDKKDKKDEASDKDDDKDEDDDDDKKDKKDESRRREAKGDKDDDKDEDDDDVNDPSRKSEGKDDDEKDEDDDDDDKDKKDKKEDKDDDKDKKPNPFAKKESRRSEADVGSGGMQPASGGNNPDKEPSAGKPGKNPSSTAGMKEAVAKGFTSLFRRVDEDVNRNLEGRRRGQ